MNYKEVLKCLKMPNYVSNDFYSMLFARSIGSGAAGYGELTGTPPLTFTANGENLLDYRIYGANGGVGEQTENLINPVEYTNQRYVDSNGNLGVSSVWVVYYVPVIAGEIYTCSGMSTELSVAYIGYCDAKKNIIGTVGERIGTSSQTVTAPANAEYLAISVRYRSAKTPMCVLGSTVPAQYIPFGYQINAEVGDGVTTTDIPIYIGDTPLAQGEYVDYRAQKVYKYVGGVLTPTDPPVALPALPTIDGATIVDFDNTPKPSELYVKYPK